MLFRIAQEALTNAWRHAHARAVALSLHCTAEQVCMKVTDTGCGFPIQGRLAEQPPSSLGLLGMRERATLVGAEVQISSVVGEGTSVEVSWLRSSPLTLGSPDDSPPQESAWW